MISFKPSAAVGWFVGLNPTVRLATAAATVFALLAVVFLVLHFLQAPQKAAQSRAQAHAAQVTTTATAAATRAVLGLQDQNLQTQRSVAQKQEEHAHAIERLPSASSAVPDSDADAWRRGLCMYDASAGDPACA